MSQVRETTSVGVFNYKTFVKGGHAAINGFQMYYEVHGTGPDTPLVTIPQIWQPASVLPSLVRNRTFIATEPRGNGRSTDLDKPWSYEETADDIAALLEQLKIPQVDVFGESIGGVPAMLLAIRHPKLVRRVVTYATPFRSFQESYRPESVREFMTLSPDHRSVRWQRETYQRVSPKPENWPQVFMKAIQIAWNGFTDEQLRAVRQPVLIVSGDHDVIGARLDIAVHVASAIPNAQLAVIPNAGHFVLNENPEKLLSVIEAFLDEPSPTVPFATTTTGFQPGETR